MITQGTGAGYTNLACSEAAGKTGTSEDESDAWFVGYTPEFSTAVWVGHPQSRETTGFGGPTAGPIWRDYMEAATAGKCPAFETPSSLPELSALTGGHTTSGIQSSHGAEEYEYEEFEEEEPEGEEEAEEEPAEEAIEEVTHAESGGGVGAG